LVDLQNFYILIFKDYVVSSKKWVNIFGGIIFFCFCLYIFNYLYLKSIYENNSFEEIVKRQIANNSIYGTALNQNHFKYKLELVKQVKPDIVALGSSRVLQFRQENFNTSFISAGNGMNYLNEGLMFLDEMFKHHKPKYIILGLDFWWFNERYPQPSFFAYHANDGQTIVSKKFIAPYLYLLQKKIDLSTIRYIYNNSNITNPYTNFDSLGMRAIKTSDGFRKDGSSFYPSIVFLEQTVDVSFKYFLNEMKYLRALFRYGKHVSEERLKLLDEIIYKIKQEGIKLIVFIPPLPYNVYKVMKDSKEYDYIEELISHVSSLKVPNFNYLSLDNEFSNNCEYIDGIHGGDVVYKRILLDIYNSKKDENFNKMLNIEQIKKDIKDFSGKVLTVRPSDKFLLKEIDFLGLGCKK